MFLLISQWNFLFFEYLLLFQNFLYWILLSPSIIYPRFLIYLRKEKWNLIIFYYHFTMIFLFKINSFLSKEFSNAVDFFSIPLSIIRFQTEDFLIFALKICLFLYCVSQCFEIRQIFKRVKWHLVDVFSNTCTFW